MCTDIEKNNRTEQYYKILTLSLQPSLNHILSALFTMYISKTHMTHCKTDAIFHIDPTPKWIHHPVASQHTVTYDQ